MSHANPSNPLGLPPLAPVARDVEPQTDNTNLLYGSNYDDHKEGTTSELVSQTVINYGVDDSQSTVRKEYLSLMGESPVAFTTRFSTTGVAVREVVDARLGAEDPATAVAFTIETEEVVVPGNRTHLFCFFNDFGHSGNRPLLDSFYGVISGAMGTVPCSQHYLSSHNDGNRSRATALLLAINEGSQIAFMVIRGWQIAPHIIMRGNDVAIPVEHRHTSMLNYALPLSGEEQTVELKVSTRTNTFRLTSLKIRRVAPVPVPEPVPAPAADGETGEGAGEAAADDDADSVLSL